MGNNAVRANSRVGLLPAPTSLPLHTTIVALSSGNDHNRQRSGDNPLVIRVLATANCGIRRTLLLPSSTTRLGARLLHLTSTHRIGLVLAANNANFTPQSVAPRIALDMTRHGTPNVTRTVQCRDLAVAPHKVLDHNIDILHNGALVIGLPNDPGTMGRGLRCVLPDLTRNVHLTTKLSNRYTQGWGDVPINNATSYAMSGTGVRFGGEDTCRRRRWGFPPRLSNYYQCHQYHYNPSHLQLLHFRHYVFHNELYHYFF